MGAAPRLRLTGLSAADDLDGYLFRFPLVLVLYDQRFGCWSHDCRREGDRNRALVLLILRRDASGDLERWLSPGFEVYRQGCLATDPRYQQFLPARRVDRLG